MKTGLLFARIDRGYSIIIRQLCFLRVFWRFIKRRDLAFIISISASMETAQNVTTKLSVTRPMLDLDAFTRFLTEDVRSSETFIFNTKSCVLTLQNTSCAILFCSFFDHTAESGNANSARIRITTKYSKVVSMWFVRSLSLWSVTRFFSWRGTPLILFSPLILRKKEIAEMLFTNLFGITTMSRVITLRRVRKSSVIRFVWTL